LTGAVQRTADDKTTVPPWRGVGAIEIDSRLKSKTKTPEIPFPTTGADSALGRTRGFYIILLWQGFLQETI